MTDFKWEHCNTCHMQFAFPNSLYLQAQEQRGAKVIFCPAGHQFVYPGESDVDRERRLRQRAEQENARLADEVAQEHRKTLKAEKALRSHQKRASAGNCPCCKRTFSNMARHMKTEHPDFGAIQPLQVVK